MSCAVNKVRVAGAPLVALLIALAPSAVRAYSDGASFDAPALTGGGGGRHFTGSSADGYSCAVCHGAVSAPAPTIDGLPTGGFESGVSYALLVRFAPQRYSSSKARSSRSLGRPAARLFRRNWPLLVHHSRCALVPSPRCSSIAARRLVTPSGSVLARVRRASRRSHAWDSVSGGFVLSDRSGS